MHLKTLTLRGFKSFASATTLRFEPGVTCVVGPNGSGKSNVVDALAWVMGEQGAKSLRGGKMEDVIFAGTSGRPPLGRAEVVLTIDNTDGALPVDYSEVTIARTMFRSGGSDYAINGQPCRLLDIQELLSDSGIGREMHVVVGQGQLDSVLSATPEERRGFVEEAAGVLKHRRRKEKALRKLDAMAGNLTRLQDLTGELRRQLGPLGRQAEVARRAAAVQADLRDARLRLLADDLGGLQSLVDAEQADEAALRAQQGEVAAALGASRADEVALESGAAADAPVLARAQQTWYALAAVRERLRGTAELAAERMRSHQADADEAPPGRDPRELAAEAIALRSQEASLQAAVAAGRDALDEAVTARATAEAGLTDEERRLAAQLRAFADRREGVARLTGQLDGLRRRVAGASGEVDRLIGARAEALGRAEQARRDFTALESTVAGLSAGEGGLDDAYEAACAAQAGAEAALARLRAQEVDADRARAALAARAEALALSLDHPDGSAALLAAAARLDGILGAVAAVVAVEPGAEAAVSAALGAVADAVAVAGLDDALAAVALLHAQDLGRAGLLVGEAPDPRTAWPVLPAGLRYAVDLVTAPSTLRPALARALHHVVVVDDLAAARAVVAQLPELVAATRDGDLVGASYVRGGSAANPSSLEVRAAYDEAADQLAQAQRRVERLRFASAEVQSRQVSAADSAAAALARLHESDAELAGVADALARLGHTARSATAEAARREAAIGEAAASRARDVAALAELEARVVAAASQQGPAEPGTEERDQLAGAATTARQRETEARLALRTSEERARALGGRADGLERAAQAQLEARERAAARRARREREAAVAEDVAAAVLLVLDRLEQSLAAAAAEREQAENRRAGREAQLVAVRERTRALAAELDELTSSVHRDEIAGAEQRLRIEALRARAVDELGVDPDTLVDEYGPHVPVPDSTAAGGAPPGRPYVRAEQDKRARAAERAMVALGKVNPLALEEFAALEERLRFLTEQLRDIEATRRGLLDIVRDVDARVERVFADAYRDVEREFRGVFARLFPGGEGRLVLTDPSDLLSTGIDVEARPPGKKIKRLSLLSGGERALVAVAFLVALFKARPSPFYVLDEVEAALDDVNLGRLLEIYTELRETSQLIVITHQKRTMEIADALYGVSMRGDGVTAVISQRLRDGAPVS